MKPLTAWTTDELLTHLDMVRDVTDELGRRRAAALRERCASLVAAYAAEMEAMNGTLNGDLHSDGASLAARHILNLIKECE